VDQSGERRRLISGAPLDRRRFLRGIAATGCGIAASGAVAGAGGLLTACGSSPKSAGTAPGSSTPRHGGSLKLGLTGGSSSDTIDPHKGVTYIDTARGQALYNSLVQLDAQAQPEYVLAESITSYKGSATEWIIRLRPGVTFHDGQDFTADDVLYSFRRIVSGKLTGSNGLGPIDLTATKALDKLTVQVSMSKPFAGFVEQLASFWYYTYIAPAAFDPAKPNGTGPFVYQSFSPGERSVFTRNPHYWRNGLPYADTLTIIDFSDSVSLQDALTTGVIQGAGTLDGPQVAALAATSGVQTVVSHSGSIAPFTMRVDQAPFSDVNVRQALRLLVDRQQLIDSALDGYGTVANDVFSPFDADFDQSLHRQMDIPQAKFLLKKAGQENLTVQLVTSPVTTGMVAMATVLAEQASAAGVRINLKQVPPGTFFGPSYLSWTFSQDYYNYSPYLPQVAYSMLPASPFNETHNDSPHYNSLYDQASATLDAATRRQILYEMQQFDFTQGGYIIPMYVDSLDAYSDKISGYGPAKIGQPLSDFGFERFWFV
jgi:peptide/nickel transport system substrate-binding protein